MKLRDVIQAEKTEINIGDWKSGKIPYADFPMPRARSKHYKFGPDFKWCVIRFSALGRNFRVRVLLREGREIFRAALLDCSGAESRVLCEYEYHGTEPGWHCHAHCDQIVGAAASFARFGSIRLPSARNNHRRRAFGVTMANAKQRAMKFYKIEERGPLL